MSDDFFRKVTGNRKYFPHGIAMLVVRTIPFHVGLSALARPETVASDPYASKDSFESRAAAPQNNLKLDRRQHSDEKLPILPSGGTRAKQEILREIDEVRDNVTTIFHVYRVGLPEFEWRVMGLYD